MKTKKLFDISWQVLESDYRLDSSLSYSTIAKFDREGFNKLNTLFERSDTPSLTFGSAVDALITGGQEEFDNTFIVADFPPITDSVLKVVKVAFNRFSTIYKQLYDIPTQELIKLTEELSYQLNWKPETRVKVIKESGSEYYNLLYVAGNKKILSQQTKEQVDKAVEALKNSESTKWYFQANNPFDTRYYREYQLKYKATLNNIPYRCMMDLSIIDYEEKIVYPCDLKTSSHYEWDFYKSFIEWSYSIQARLYWRILRENMNNDSYFRDFKLADYTFIVVNKNSLTPLVWKYEDTQKHGTLFYGRNKQIEVKDPEDLGKELYSYLSYMPSVPKGININDENSLIKKLEEL